MRLFLLILLAFSNTVVPAQEANILLANQYMEKAQVLRASSSYDSSIFYLEEAAKIYEKVEYWEKWLKSYNEIARNYFVLSNYKKALVYLQKALNKGLQKLEKDNPGLAGIYNGIGIIYRNQGAYEKALKVFLKAQDIQMKALKKDDPRLASIYNNMGVVYHNQGNFVKTLEYFQKSIDIWLKTLGEIHPDVAMAYNNMGVIYKDQRAYAKALEYYQKAIDIWLETLGSKHPNIAMAYNNIGIVYRAQGSYRKALEYYQKAIDIRLKTLGQEHPLITSTYDNVGLVYRDLGYYKKALKYHQKALDTRLKFDAKHPVVGKSYGNTGLTYQSQGSYRKALEYYQKALINLVAKFDSTSIHMNPSFNHFDQVSSKPIMLEVLINKSFALKKYYEHKTQDIKDLKFSLETTRLALDLLDSMRNEYMSSQTKRELAEKNISKVYERAIETALDLFAVTGEENFLYQAFEASERSKSYLLREALNESAARQFAGIPDSLLQQEEDLKIQLSFYEKKRFEAEHPGFGKEVDSTKVQYYQNQLFEKKRAYEKLVDILEKDYPDYYQIKYDTKVTSVEDLRSTILSDSSAFIEYFMGDSSMYVFSITQQEIKVHVIKDFTEVEKVSEALQSVFATYPPDLSVEAYESFTTSSHSLYEKLLLPVLESLRSQANKLIVSLDGNLSSLPIELLLYKGAPFIEGEEEVNYANLPYLLQKYQISYTYSATLLQQNKKIPVHAHRKETEVKKECLVFAPTYGEGNTTYAKRGGLETLRNKGLVDLPGAQREAQNISNYVDGLFLFDVEAREANFKQEASNYSIIHLAVHAELEDQDPLYSRLYFTNTNDTIEDDTLHTYELYNMQLSAELVVLSGCETGMGEYVRGEGVMSLSRGFMYAGTPSVLLSMWKVSDIHTSELMDYFYSNLSEGLPKDASLRLAKQRYVERSDRLGSHPYYWASFVLYGDPQPIVFGDNFSNWWLWYGIIAIIIILLALLLIKRKEASKSKKELDLW